MTKLFINIDNLDGLDTKISSLKSNLKGVSKVKFNPPCSFSGQNILNRVSEICSDAADDCDDLYTWIKNSVKYYDDYEKDTENAINSFEEFSVNNDSSNVVKLG